jgi:hypothetical protein
LDELVKDDAPATDGKAGQRQQYRLHHRPGTDHQIGYTHPTAAVQSITSYIEGSLPGTGLRGEIRECGVIGQGQRRPRGWSETLSMARSI